MKITALKFLCLSLVGSSLTWQTPVSAAETIVGYHRISTTAAEDSLAWSDSGRFSDIVFEESIAAYGAIASASGTTITTSGILGADDEFVYAAGSQPRHYFVEITSGANQGDMFDIIDNTSNTLTIDLGGGSLSGIAADDTFKIVAKWSLSLLFPDGADLTASTDSVKGTEVLVAAADAIPFDPSTAAKFQYRSDLTRWVNVNDTATDAGDDAIAHGSQVVLRQSSATPITPIFAGTVASTGVNPLKVNINYLEAGLDSFANALDISGSGSKAVDSSTASGEGSEPQHGGNATSASVWFKYTASDNGALLINSDYSEYDTVLAVYTGNALGNLQPVASNDDSNGVTSETFFNVTAGQEYYIALDGKAGAGGAGYLNYQVSVGTIEEPAGFNMSAASAAGMNLQWNVAGGADKYRIYRSTDGTFEGATMIAEVEGNVSSYQDTTMHDGVNYSYWVEAGNGYIRNLTSSSIMARSRSHTPLVSNTSVPAAITIGGSSVTSDFDGNGVDDLLVQNQVSGEIGWWNLDNTGDVIGGELLGINPGADWQLVNHADFNSDDNPDLLLRNQNSGEVVAWTLNGTELDFASSLSLGGSGEFSTAADWKVAGAASSGDDVIDVASQNASTGQIAFWEVTSSSDTGYDVGLGQLFNTQPTSINWKLIGLRDFNSDGANDLFWQNQSSGTMAVWFLNDDKDLLSASAISLQTNDPTWEVRGLGDWDGDNKTDISLQNSATGAIVLWYLDGVTYRSSSTVQNPAAGSWEVRNSDQGQ